MAATHESLMKQIDDLGNSALEIKAARDKYAVELGKCWEIVNQWSSAAGWPESEDGDLLHDYLARMRDRHLAEGEE